MKTLPLILLSVIGLLGAVTNACDPSDGKTILDWMRSCDSVGGGSQAKCDNKQCHIALHRLIEEETVECFLQLGLGSADVIRKYLPLDTFCHKEGPDPAAPSTQTPATTSPVKPPVTKTPPPPPPSPTTKTPPLKSNAPSASAATSSPVPPPSTTSNNDGTPSSSSEGGDTPSTTTAPRLGEQSSSSTGEQPTSASSSGDSDVQAPAFVTAPVVGVTSAPPTSAANSGRYGAAITAMAMATFVTALSS